MTACTLHRTRIFRDPDGRPAGALCLTCGLLIAASGRKLDPADLEAYATRFLADEDAGRLELGKPARRRLQAARRRNARKART